MDKYDDCMDVALFTMFATWFPAALFFAIAYAMLGFRLAGMYCGFYY